MGLLKTLGLSPAKKAGAATSKAFRRLLDRVLPAGGGEVAAGTGTSSHDIDTESNQNRNHNHNNNNHNKSNKSGKDNKNNRDKHTDDARGKSKESTRPTTIQSTEDAQLSPATDLSSETANTNNTNTATTANSDPAMALDNMAAPDLLQKQQQQAQRLQQPSQNPQLNKENQPPEIASLAHSVSHLSLKDDASSISKAAVPVAPVILDPAVLAEREKHMRFIEEALDMARLALKTNETPVGCVLVCDDKVIARGMNATNVTRNGTRHAEFMALSALLSHPPTKGPKTTSLKPKLKSPVLAETSDTATTASGSPDEGNEDGSKGHLYPYGQKLHPDDHVDRAIIRKSILYVTVEPCVMCASIIRQLGIKKVYFGAVNDKFGGTGGVFSIHANSFPISPDGQTASAHPTPRALQLAGPAGTLGVSFPPGGGDGGNIEPGYEIEGGWGRDEAVALLRRFYVQENGRAPVPRKKEGRAARLAAMMERDGDGASINSAEQDELMDLTPSADDLKENINPIIATMLQDTPSSEIGDIPVSKNDGGVRDEALGR
ncbi:hypothetical protein G7046_g7685 [Stylonectria norvegica]|nr:hypothetical protein G7046_g7685 [Stylonectria norvegica]